MKAKYTKPEIAIKLLYADDVVRTSSPFLGETKDVWEDDIGIWD